MANYSDETREHHRELVRNVLAMNPAASSNFVRKTLEQNGFNLDIRYLNKVVKKVKTERFRRFDRDTASATVAELQERTQAAQLKMWEILADSKQSAKAKIMAADVAMKYDFKLFEAKMDAGIFERKLGEIDVKHTYQLPADQASKMVKALHNLGVMKKVVATVVEPKELPDGKRNKRTRK